MKKLYIIALLLCATVATLSAQTAPKLGHINSQQLMAIMPETKQKQGEFEEFAKKMEQSLEAIQVEFNQKYKVFVDGQTSMSSVDRESKELELQSLQERIQAFQTKAQEEIANKRKALFGPVMEKAQNAIKEVGKENGFYYIFDVTVGSIIYAADDATDILPLVKAKLGIQ